MENKKIYGIINDMGDLCYRVAWTEEQKKLWDWLIEECIIWDFDLIALDGEVVDFNDKVKEI